MYQVYLTYFKSSGKYYTEGRYVSLCQHAWEIFDEVRQKNAEKTLPGLQSGEWVGYIYVNIPEMYPALVDCRTMKCYTSSEVKQSI